MLGSRRDGRAAADGPPLRLERLSKHFSGTVAVDDLSLTIERGEIYALIGPNGSGKTTTVKLTTGLYRPTSGRVLVRGVDVHESTTRAAAVRSWRSAPRCSTRRSSSSSTSRSWGWTRRARFARASSCAISRRGGAVLLCTHTLAFAEAVSGRIGMLRTGTLIVEGHLADLRTAMSGAASLEDLYLHFAAAP